jgi:hypothetical protein
LCFVFLQVFCGFSLASLVWPWLFGFSLVFNGFALKNQNKHSETRPEVDQMGATIYVCMICACTGLT